MASNLSEISDLKFQDDDSSEALLGVIRSYERTKKQEKDNLLIKKEKANDSLKEANSFIAIKTSELNK